MPFNNLANTVRHDKHRVDQLCGALMNRGCLCQCVFVLCVCPYVCPCVCVWCVCVCVCVRVCVGVYMHLFYNVYMICMYVSCSNVYV